MKKENYLVIELNSGKSTVFDSMEKLLDCYKCVTKARVLYCIESGERYKGLVFDIMEEDSEE